MPDPLKIVATNTFTDGVDTVTDRSLMLPQRVRYMLNCLTMASAQGNVGVVTNIKGNSLISVDLPDGDCRVLGWADDEEVDKFYYFVWNANKYHTIYRYDGLLNTVAVVMQNLTDTGDVDILCWDQNDLILMSDVVNNHLLYWVKNGNDAAKININKAMDKSPSGYGVITADVINAYKLAPTVAPSTVYYSDTTVNVNRWYGTLARFACRFIYDDGEISNWSDYSNVAIPGKESFTGVNFVPTENNAQNVTVPTGGKLVVKIQLAMQYTLDGGYSDWVDIVTLDKKRLSIGDNSFYTYTFYNDGQYAPVDQEKIIRPYSYLPKAPKLQAFTKQHMIYGNFSEGFENVAIDMNFENIIYEPLFLDPSTEDKLNNPSIVIQVDGGEDAFDYIRNKTVTFAGSGEVTKISGRAVRWKMTIGSDVKAGNNYVVRYFNGTSDFTVSYMATITDTATTVANKLKAKLIATNRILLTTPDLGTVDVFVNTNDSGDISFRYILVARGSIGFTQPQYFDGTANVNAVNTVTLKDTGQSVLTMKLGAATKYGIMYEDFDGRRSLVYTDVKLIVKTSTQNELNGLKKVKLILNINHQPPIWAKWYQIVRTDDLTYNNFIQMVIQKVTVVNSTDQDTGEYLDLTVGSLFTYQKIHPNTTLKYEFKKGDRLRLISKEDGSYYDFLETEILSYNEVVTELINQNVKITGTDEIEVAESSTDNIGKFIVIDGNEREIIARVDSTHYTLNHPIGGPDDQTFLSYTLIDRRGSIRIRKPSIDIEDISLVEIFTPSFSTDLNNKEFFHFNKKFEIIDAGMATRAHNGDVQIQNSGQPAKVSITEGTVYVRNREMPVTNDLPAQVVVRSIEDPSFSDFYFSLINDNGKTNVEDNGAGVVHFGSRLRFSNNYIEDTQINGLNDFDNLDRKDYNDKYGDFVRIVFAEQQLLAFKQLKVGIIPIFQSVIIDEAGQQLLGTSSKLLNEIRYYSHLGGIGNNPEAYCQYETRHYYACVNMGTIVRLGGDGATPISEVYFLDNEMRDLLAQAYTNKAKVYIAWDVNISALVVAVSNYNAYTFNSVFNQANWKVLGDPIPDDTVFELSSQTTHGIVTLDGNIATVVEDYVGKDSFTYRAFVNGVWVDKKLCIEYTDLPNRMKAWKADLSDAVCQTVEGENTGFLLFITLLEYYTDNGELTGQTKPNLVGDPDYIAPIQDYDTCPFDGDVFRSAEYTAYATKNNCILPAVAGPPVALTANEGDFTSVISQLDADQKAIDYVEANKQGNANSFGTCVTPSTVGNDLRTRSVQKNDCTGGQVGTFWTARAEINTFFGSTKAAANAAADAALAGSFGQGQANANGTCVTPSTFTLQILINTDYSNAGFFSTDPRGANFEFYNNVGGLKTSKLLSSTITRDGILHTYSVNFDGVTFNLGYVKLLMRYNATTVAKDDTETLYKNGVIQGSYTHAVSAGIASGTPYAINLAPAGSITVATGDTIKIVHGDTAPSCDLFVSFVSKTNETSAGAANGTITVNAGTSYGGGFLLSKNGGGSYPYAGTNPYTFTGLTAGTYTISAINSDGSCATSLSPVTIDTDPTYYSKGTGYGGSDSTIACAVMSGGFPLYGLVSGALANGDAVFYYSAGMYLPYTASSHISWTVGGVRVYATVSGGYLTSNPIACPTSCDLGISFVSKTNETGAGLNNGTITINGYTSYSGGFILSRDNGVTFPYTGTSPYTFTGLAPGTYTIKAKNADGSCLTGISPVTINAYVPPACDLSIAFVSKTDETSSGANNGTITITGSTSYSGGFVLSKDNGATYPVVGTSPYTFTGLAPGTYNIKARNADGTCVTSIPAVTINAYVPPSNVFITLENNTTGSDATIISGSIGSQSVFTSLSSGGSLTSSPLTYTTTPVTCSVGLSFASGSYRAFYYAKFYKNGSLLGTRSYDKSTVGSGSTTISYAGISIAINDVIKIEVTFQTYSAIGLTNETGFNSSSPACSSSMGDTTLYSSSGLGTLNVGDIALKYDASLYGKLIPILLTSPNNYMSYQEGGAVKWVRLSPTTGEVLEKGNCSSCDLSISFVSKTDESSFGANDGTITITGSTSYGGGFLLSRNGGSSYPYTGTSPYTFTGLAPGTYNIAAINADGSCATSLGSPVVINGGVAYLEVPCGYYIPENLGSCVYSSCGRSMFTTSSVADFNIGDTVYAYEAGSYVLWSSLGASNNTWMTYFYLGVKRSVLMDKTTSKVTAKVIC